MDYYTTTLMEHLVQIFSKIGSGIFWKAPVMFLAVVADYLIGAGNFATMGMLLILVMFDFITALMAQYKMGKTIESKKALKTVSKIVVYALLVSGTFLTEKIIPGTTFLDNMVISFLAITELISIIENIGHMGYAVPKKLLNRLEDIQKSS